MRWARICVLAALASGASGCSFLSSSHREYVSNRDLIRQASTTAGFVVAADLFTLIALDLREDALTYQYRGAQYPGDHAWVVRFSQKSSEQNPLAVRDVYGLLPLIQAGRVGFRIVEEGEASLAEQRARYVRYRFDSPIRDGAGKPLEGHGIVTSIRVETAEGPIVHHVKLDNHGDRDDVAWEDLAPLLPAAPLN